MSEFKEFCKNSIIGDTADAAIGGNLGKLLGILGTIIGTTISPTVVFLMDYLITNKK